MSVTDLVLTVIFEVFTAPLCTVTLKDADFLLARITLTVVLPAFLPAVSLKAPFFVTEDTFTIPVFPDVTLVT